MECTSMHINSTQNGVELFLRPLYAVRSPRSRAVGTPRASTVGTPRAQVFRVPSRCAVGVLPPGGAPRGSRGADPRWRWPPKPRRTCGFL